MHQVPNITRKVTKLAYHRHDLGCTAVFGIIVHSFLEKMYKKCTKSFLNSDESEKTTRSDKSWFRIGGQTYF